MKELLDLLHSREWIGVSRTVDIAKGKDEIVTNWIDAKKKIKRIWLKKE
jgi:hypothetical protein